VITHRNPVISAVALALNLVCIAGFYLLLNAQFIAILQVMVYAGAIMVLILFVIMLLNLQQEQRLSVSQGIVQRVAGPVAAAVLIVLLGSTVMRYGGRSLAEPTPGFGSVSALGEELFSTFFYPFEVVSLLLVAAMVGAVLLAKRSL